MDSKNISKLQRSNTIEQTQHKDIFDDILEIKRSATEINIEKPEDESAKSKEKNKKAPVIIQKKTAETADLKSKVGKQVNVVVPKKKKEDAKPVKLSSAQKKAQARQKAAEEAKKKETEYKNAQEAVRAYHEILEAEEARIYGKDVGNLRKTRLEDIGESNLNKRVKNALKRQKFAQKISQIEDKWELDYKETKPIDREELVKVLDRFSELPDEPKDMSTDEKFIENLEYNMNLCESADRVKFWVEDAVTRGFMPEDVDMEELQTKIAGLLETRNYIYTQKELMKNPYYFYLAKKDVTYSETQLDKLQKEVKDDTLKNYLLNLKNIKGLDYVRKKGMKSVEKKSEETGKKNTELIKTRNDKKLIISRLEEHALNFRGNKRFQDPDYDSKYTPEVFRDMLDKFNAVSISDLHMKSIADMTDHFDENAYLFEQARSMEHMLMCAINAGHAPEDSVLIKLRAKLFAFQMAEHEQYYIQEYMVEHSEEVLNNRTYKDISDFCIKYITDKFNATGDKLKDIGLPQIGCDLDKYYRTVLASMKKEHKNRRETIKKAYAFTHLKRSEDDEGWDGGEISEDELNERAARFEQNAFITDYIAGMEQMGLVCDRARMDTFKYVYEKKLGLKHGSLPSLGRVYSKEAIGVSSDELKRIFDVLHFGTPEEKDKFAKKILDRARKLNLHELNSTDQKTILSNIAFKYMAAGEYGNLSDIEKLLLSEKDRKEARALYNIGCSHAQYFTAFSQAMESGLFRSVYIKDWFDTDYKAMSEYTSEVDESDEGVAYLNGKMVLNYDEWSKFGAKLGRIPFLQTNTYSMVNMEYKKLEYRNTPAISRYEFYKKEGLWKDTTAEETDDLKSFYNTFYDKHKNETDKRLTDLAGQPAGEEKAKAIENIFKELMTVDLSIFNFDSYSGIIEDTESCKDRFAKCHNISRLATSFDNLIMQYEACRSAKKGKFLLNAEYLKEIKSRADLIKTAEPIYGQAMRDILNSGKLKGKDNPEGMSLDELMHLPVEVVQQNIDNAARKKDAKEQSFWNGLKDLRDKSEDFDAHVAFEGRLQYYRTLNDAGTYSNHNEVVNILEGKRSSVFKDIKLKDIRYAYLDEKSFRSQFKSRFSLKKYSVTQRYNKMSDTDSRLHDKKHIADELLKQSNDVKNVTAKRRQNIDLKYRRLVDEETFNELSMFMYTGNKNDTLNLDILQKYTDPESRKEILGRFAGRIMEYEINFDIASDEDFMVNAEHMEIMSRQALAFKKLLDKNPDYKELMNVPSAPGEMTDGEKLRIKLNEMLALSDYYRARKMLITNPYYVMHYNDELSGNHDHATTVEQRRVADLINLVSRCTRRLEHQAFNSREDDNIEHVLDEMERSESHNAYLEYRLDLNKATAKETAKANAEIRRYLKKVVESFGKDENGKYLKDPDFVYGEISISKSEHPYPDLEQYETDAVKDHIKMIRTNQFLKSGYNNLLATKKEKNTGARLKKVISHDVKNVNPKTGVEEIKSESIQSFTFEDPKTGEKLSFGSKPDRLISAIAMVYGKDLPEEEIAEILEGFMVQYRDGIDMNKDEDREYAKSRWLDSAARLFELEYRSVKKFESTFGALSSQLPLGGFMNAMGENKADIFKLILFGQDMTEICDEKDTVVDGKKMSMGQYLADKGLISQSALDDAIQVNTNYYQCGNDAFKNYVSHGVSAFFKDINPNGGFSNASISMTKQYHMNNTHKFSGPTLTFAQERKFWKDALASRESDSICGNETSKTFYRKKLGLYNEEERKELKVQRRKDARIIQMNEWYVAERTVDLIAEIGKRVGDDITEEMISGLIAFHPAMLTRKLINPEKPEDAIPEKEHDEFIALLKDYYGIGVTDQEKKGKKLAAIDKMISQMKKAGSGGINAYDLEDRFSHSPLITDEDRNHENEVSVTTKIYKNSVRRSMSEAVQNIMTDTANKQILTEKQYKAASDAMARLLSTQIVRAIHMSERFRSLKDLGNREESVPDIKLEYLERLALSMRSNTLEREDVDFLEFSDEFFDNLKEAGIRFEKEIWRRAHPETVKEAKDVKDNETKPGKENIEKPKSETIDAKYVNAHLIIDEDEEEGEINTTSDSHKETTGFFAIGNNKNKNKIDNKDAGKGNNRINANEIPEYEQDARAALPYAERVKIYTPEALVTHTQALLDLGYKVPTSGDDVAFLRGELMDTVKDQNDVQHYVRKADVPAEVYAHLDWLGTYYKTQNDTLDQNVKDKPIHAIPIDFKIKAKVGIKGMVNAYEKQDTNNCFCVAGAALVNQFLSRHKRDKLVGQYVTQRDMRGFIPEIRKYDPAFADKGVSPEVYQRAVDEMKQYTGQNTTRPGNIYAMGDFILDALQKEGHGDAVLNKMEFMIPGDIQLTERNRNKANNMKAVMMSRIGEVINAGGIVSICYTDDVFVHYITVTEINGDRLTVLDSSGYARKSKEMSIDQFIQGGQTIELTWISDLKKPEEMKAEFSNLQYDAEHGYSVKDLPPEQARAHILNVAHTKGISVNKTLAELGGDDYEGIFQHAYIPNPKVQVDSMPIGEFNVGEQVNNQVYYTTASNTVTITGEENRTKSNDTATKNKGETSIFTKTTRKKKTEEKEQNKGETSTFSKTTRKAKTAHKETTATAHKETTVKKEPIIIPPYKMEGSVKKITDKAIAAFEKKCDEKIDPRQDYLDEKLQTYKQDNEAKKMGYKYMDNVDEKLLTTMASHLAYFTNDTKEQSMEFIRSLYVDVLSHSKRELGELARNYEKIFRTVLEFDIKKMNFSKPSDLISTTKVDVFVMTKLMECFDPAFLTFYEKLKGNATNIWPEEKLNEFKARWELLRNNLIWFRNIYTYLDVLRDENIEFPKLLSMKPNELEKLSKDSISKPDLSKFYHVLALAIENSTGSGFGFGPGVDAELVLEKIRTEKYGLKPTFKKDDLSVHSETGQMKFYGEYAKAPVSDEVLERTFGKDKIMDDLQDAYRTGTQGNDINKELSALKKAKSVRQKPDIAPARNYLLEEERRLIEKRRAHNELVKQHLSDNQQKNIFRLFPTKSDREMFRELYIQPNNDRLELNSTVGDRNTVNIQTLSNVTLPQILNADIRQFEFGSDEEFVSRFAQKYDFLCRAYSAGMLLRKYNKSNEYMSAGRHLCEYMAKTQVLMEVKQEYEDRMKLISSPYYEYLKGADLSAYKGKSGENLMKKEGLSADLKDYIRLHHKVAAAKYSQNIRTTYESRLKAVRKDKGKEDLAVLKSYFKGVNINQAPSDVILEVFEKKKNAVKRSYPKDDREFQEKYRVTTAGVIVLGIEDDTDRIIAAEKDMIDILYEGTFKGVNLSGKAQKTVAKAIKEYFNMRREHMASQAAMDYTQSSENVCSCDLNNPVLLNSKEGRLMVDMAELGGLPRSKTDDINRVISDCFAKLYNVYTVLMEEGVVLNEKLQAPMQDDRKIDGAVEKRRLELENELKQNGNKDAHFEFPTFTINGKQYTDYTSPRDIEFRNTMDFIKQYDNVNLAGAPGEELTGLMDELTGFMKKRQAAISLYGSLKGEKLILHTAYMSVYGKEIKRISERIKDILGKNK